MSYTTPSTFTFRQTTTSASNTDSAVLYEGFSSTVSTGPVVIGYRVTCLAKLHANGKVPAHSLCGLPLTPLTRDEVLEGRLPPMCPHCVKLKDLS